MKTNEQRRLTKDRVRLDWFAAVGVAGHGCGRLMPSWSVATACS